MHFIAQFIIFHCNERQGRNEFDFLFVFDRGFERKVAMIDQEINGNSTIGALSFLDNGGETRPDIVEPVFCLVVLGVVVARR